MLYSSRHILALAVDVSSLYAVVKDTADVARRILLKISLRDALAHEVTRFDVRPTMQRPPSMPMYHSLVITRQLAFFGTDQDLHRCSL